MEGWLVGDSQPWLHIRTTSGALNKMLVPRLCPSLMKSEYFSKASKKDTMELPAVMKIFCILAGIAVMSIHGYVHSHIHQDVHSNLGIFTCELSPRKGEG